jgi:hypothetical protein
VEVDLRLPRHTYRRISRGNAIRFEREGSNGLLVFRLFAAVLLGGFALMPPVALYAFSDGRLVSAVLAVPLFTVFPWYPTLGLMAWGLGEATGSWRWIEIDADGGRIRARRDGFLLLGHRIFERSSRDLTSVELDLRHDTPHDEPTPGLRVGYEGLDLPILGPERKRTFVLRGSGLRDRDRLLAFTFEVARALGWSGYRLERNDHLSTSIRLRRRASDGRPVPDPALEGEVPDEEGAAPGAPDAADLDPAGTETEAMQERSGASPQIPSVELPPFDPAALDATSYEVTEWAPGERVVVRKPGLRGGKLLVASVLGTLLLNLPTLAAGVVILTGTAGEVSLFWKAVVLAVFLFVTVLYNAYLFTEGRARRETVFDWAAGTVRMALYRREGTLPLDAVEGLEVRGVEHVRRGSDGTTRRYGCEVHLLTSEGEALVLATGTGPRRDAPYVSAGSFAEDVADALGVSWRWRGWRRRTLCDSVRRLLERPLAREDPSA